MRISEIPGVELLSAHNSMDHVTMKTNAARSIHPELREAYRRSEERGLR